MHDVTELVEGYRRFQSDHYPAKAELYRTLTEAGQTPKTMVIACCDSRVDPAVIFQADPGELFVVRNVANLVPPYEQYGNYHGTSAAVEFAVTGLGVAHIVVLGHAKCGGIRAFLEDAQSRTPRSAFIGKWMSLLNPARAKALHGAPELSVEARQTAMEQAGIVQSLENLMTFPFVKDQVEAGRLHLHGGYFDIADGRLFTYDHDTLRFRPISPG